jgi:hypothetical protein
MTRTLRELLSGNERHADRFRSRFDDVQDSQAPEAVTVCCADSRVLQDHAWDNDEPGRIFTVSNIGNRVVQRTDVGTVVSGDVLYPIEHTGTETAVVVGHSGCGAVTATYDSLTDGLDEPPGIEHCLSLLEPRLEPALGLLPEDVGRAGTTSTGRSMRSWRVRTCQQPSPSLASSTTSRIPTTDPGDRFTSSTSTASERPTASGTDTPTWNPGFSDCSSTESVAQVNPAQVARWLTARTLRRPGPNPSSPFVRRDRRIGAWSPNSR